MGNLRYKNYTGSVEYSEQDDCLYGKVIGLSKQCITYEGKDIQELKQDFQNAVDDYLLSCKENNVQPDKPYKGSFNVRVGPEKHGRIACQSLREGISLNTYVNNALDYYHANGH